MLAQTLLPKYKCHSCSPELKRERGCNAKPRYPMRLDGEDLERCPLRPYLDEPDSYNELFVLYNWYRRNLLPDPGTMLDQSHALVECFLVVDAAVRDAEKERSDRDSQSKKRAADASKRAAAAKGQQGGKPSGARGRGSRR